MEITEVKAIFFDSEALREPSYQVRRIDQNSNRFYVAFNPVTGEYLKTKSGSLFFQSVTAFIKNSQPTSIHLQKWYAERGWERAKYEAQQAADYGTLMHIWFGKLLIKGVVALDGIGEFVKIYILEKGYSLDLLNIWTDNLVSDLLAFAQWCADYEVTPLAVEVTLVSLELGVAGTLDLFCKMNDKCYTEKTEKDKRKRINAIVDFKSGRKGFYDDYEVQLEAYKYLWNENFPDDLRPDAIFNFAPTEWRKQPDYKFKNQTGAVNTELLKHFISIAEITGEGRKPSFFEYKGDIELGKAPTNNFSFIGEEELKERLFGEQINTEP